MLHKLVAKCGHETRLRAHQHRRPDDSPSACRPLKKAGYDAIHEDKGVSGALSQRPALSRCLDALQPGDTLIVWKLDRLGRSLRDLIALLDDLKQRGVKFQSWGCKPKCDVKSRS